MTFVGNLARKHFEPLMLSFQVLVDLGVVLVACLLGYVVGLELGGTGPAPPMDVYTWLWAMIGVVCLSTFYAFGMYSPVKSILNVEEYKSILKSTTISFLVLQTLLIFMHTTKQGAEGSFYSWLVPIHRWIDVRIDPFSFSRVTMVTTFLLILLLSVVSRFCSFKLIQDLHRRGIGNRNALVLGTGDMGQWLQRKFHLVPTLGLRIVGYVTQDPGKVGRRIGGAAVLGTVDELAELIGRHKISEAFVAMPEVEEDQLMAMIAKLEELDVTYRVVPRFYHLLSRRVRIENLDSIPLISRAERRQNLIGDALKRGFDVVFSLVALLLAAPLFCLAAWLVRRESPGPIFFRQTRIGLDAQPFKVLKFRTMYEHMSGDAPTPTTDHDPRVTKVGRWLRRTSLDELPQFINVLRGQMSIVGPRPEMAFIVETYGALGRERLRVKPGITGLWQVSSSRQQAIHETLDYDIYYVENHSMLLDMVIISLTLPAMIRGTGAH